MRTTVAIDDKLLEAARKLTGLKVTSRLIERAFEALIQRESARRLALLGGSEPGLEAPSRRRP